MKPNNTTSAPSSDNAAIGLRARNAFIWVASTSAIWQIISWALTLFTARILTPDDFGVAALPGTVMPYLALIASLRLGTWIVQEPTWNRERSEAITTLSILLGVLATLFAFLGAPLLAQFYEQPELTLMFQICAFIFLIENIQIVPDAELRRDLKFKAISLIAMVSNIGQGILTLICALAGFGYWSLIYGILFAHLARTVGIVAVQGIHLSFRWDSALYRPACRFGIAAASASALWIVYSTTDDIIVGKLFGTRELGIYTMAYFFSQLPLSKLSMIITPVLHPYYSGLKNTGASLSAPYLRTVRSLLAITSPALIGLAITAPKAIAVLLGAEWLEMVPILRVLCIVALMQSLTMNAPSLLNAIGHPGEVTRYSAISSCLLPPAFLIGGLTFGLPGVYYAWLLTYPVVTIIILKTLEKFTGISTIAHLKAVRAPLLSACGMAGILFAASMYLPPLSETPQLILHIGIGAISYFTLMYCCFRKEFYEIVKMKQEISG